MQYYIGVDGGGTKTAFAMADENGKMYGELYKAGASYKHAGWDATFGCIEGGVKELLAKVPARKEDVYICIGAPNYGESKEFDQKLEEGIGHILKGYHFKIVNDCEVGWAGSLGLKPGINIVAGTGSIGFGKDSYGTIAQAGGWSDFFGDEGSCRWLGVKAIELFSKQADGREERGPLYDVVMEHFHIEEPVDLIDLFETEYQPYREKLAGLQRLLLAAAEREDKKAQECYEKAAAELAMIIKAVYRKLKFEEACTVSYSGGLFRVGDRILRPLLEELKDYNIKFCSPLYEPVKGAVLLAAELAGGKICI